MADEKKPTTKRTRVTRIFPASVFSEALDFVKRIYDIGGGQEIRRLTLFDEIGKSSESSASRMLVTNSAKYGLTKGSYTAEFIEITPLGLKAVGQSVSVRECERAKIESAIVSISPFNSLYELIVGNKLPATSVLVDKIKSFEVSAECAEEAVDTFIVNLRDVGLLKTLSGQERVIPIDMRLDELPSKTERLVSPDKIEKADQHFDTPLYHPVVTAGHAEFETTAFYISPIGEDGSDTRKHADLFSASIVEPALEQSKLRLVRADKIDTPGIITRQILDYIINSRLVIVDLSFGNPNVFYELAIRHMMRKPIVQIMRGRDRIPFDINQSRTIKIDDDDIYTFVPKMPVYVATISAQIRQALDNPDAVDNPISIYFPKLRAVVD
ncbi:hypothetical protein [Cypionkella sp.]|uniref:hypothetical protein n=1 Tax=Cypionkella sp. TaxID=2811411 RepID=UPI003753C89F